MVPPPAGEQVSRVRFDYPKRVRNVAEPHTEYLADRLRPAGPSQLDDNLTVVLPHVHMWWFVLARRQVNNDTKTTDAQDSWHHST
jgi:hypothetical protein